MLKKEVLNKMNEQINLEHFSSNLYLSMSSWCKAQGLNGAASFLETHSSEELGHMYKLFKYINETGSQAIVGALDAPDYQFKDIKDVFERTYKHEQFITNKINELVELTLAQKDYATFNFLQWYVSEQHEEEALFKGILDKMSIIGLEGRGLHMIDKEIGTLVRK
ncbi:MAG: non-heme ferritin [Candidatus Marinarcus sp.]|uniref:non-heme ferritin n=1 Tax=Candidatus Marinarcus sp. TaxID=3100987 RepID=UPI003AFFF200